jgi:hypothetical protein
VPPGAPGLPPVTAGLVAAALEQAVVARSSATAAAASAVANRNLAGIVASKLAIPADFDVSREYRRSA